MGMFTTVKATDGMEVQFHCGWDDCETYSIGDTVKWEVIPDCAGEGKLLDGVYQGYASKDGQDLGDKWVVIENHVIQAILDLDRSTDEIY